MFPPDFLSLFRLMILIRKCSRTSYSSHNLVVVVAAAHELAKYVLEVTAIKVRWAAAAAATAEEACSQTKVIKQAWKRILEHENDTRCNNRGGGGGGAIHSRYIGHKHGFAANNVSLVCCYHSLAMVVQCRAVHLLSQCFSQEW